MPDMPTLRFPDREDVMLGRKASPTAGSHRRRRSVIAAVVPLSLVLLGLGAAQAVAATTYPPTPTTTAPASPTATYTTTSAAPSSPTSSSSVSPTYSATATPTATVTSSTTASPTVTASPTPSGVIPSGAPGTGGGSTAASDGTGLLISGAGCLLLAAALAGFAYRRKVAVHR
jgi:hypothetical protein